jgi:hypothetical protein
MASLLPWPPASGRRAGAPGATPAADSRAELEAELTGALVQALARDVRASGARGLLLMTDRHWQRLDTRALLADQIEPYAVWLSPAVQPSQVRFRNDSHLNASGHRWYADGLLPLVEGELRAALRLQAEGR